MVSNASVRPPAVAGLFYSDDAAALRDCVSGYLARASVKDLPDGTKAFIVPHAGYMYSGSTAAAAYASVATAQRQPRRVVLIGPSHRVYLEGVALPKVSAFATPLGTIEIDGELQSILKGCPGVIESDEPHRHEHSLEVQLPFLQVLLGEFTLLPLLGGVASPEFVASLLNELWGDEQTLVIASSDLSHYHPYSIAEQIDAATSGAIQRREPVLTGDQACGAVAINGLLAAAGTRRLEARELARCNSGDTAGDRDRVVGYGAYAFYEPNPHSSRGGWSRAPSS